MLKTRARFKPRVVKIIDIKDGLDKESCFAVCARQSCIIKLDFQKNFKVWPLHKTSFQGPISSVLYKTFFFKMSHAYKIHREKENRGLLIICKAMSWPLLVAAYTYCEKSKKITKVRSKPLWKLITNLSCLIMKQVYLLNCYYDATMKNCNPNMKKKVAPI